MTIFFMSSICSGTNVGAAALVAFALLAFQPASGILLTPRANSPELHAEPLTRKPRGDSRSYQAAVLSNGIQVVNVRDASAVTSAFSVAVDAGSLDDPKELPGLAHFCEHMLFLGTKGFPDATGFDDFVNSNGGYMNAYTAAQATVYYVELSQDAADEGMNRFGDFFWAPLFNKSFVQKEVHAIDSEHAKNVEDPGWRLFSLLESMANPLSPVGRFHTGNMDTLYTQPRKEGIDPVDSLRVWFTSHYCPSRMHLVTFGSENLSEQLLKSERYFGNISRGSDECQQAPKSWAAPAPWPKRQLGKWITVKGTQPQTNMNLYFPIPDIRKEFRSQPTSYIDYVLTYGGEKSLLTFLRDTLGLVTSMSLGVDVTSAGGALIVDFTLAKKGREAPKLVLDVFFQYVANLRGKNTDLALYESIANVSKLSWDWSERVEAAETVQTLSEALTRLPPQSLLSGDSLIEAPDASTLEALLAKLHPDNLNVAFVDADAQELFGDSKVQKLPYYGVEYTVADIDKQFGGDAQRWNSWLATPALEENKAVNDLSNLLKVGGISGLDSVEAPVPPSAIVGVPVDLNVENMAATGSGSSRAFSEGSMALFGPRPSLLASSGSKSQEQAALAQRAGDKGQKKSWFRRGWVTVSPKAKVQALLRPFESQSEWEPQARDDVRLKLFSTILAEEMAPKLFDQTVLGASYELGVSTGTVSMTFSGFPPLLPGLVEKSMAELKRGIDASKVERFERVRQSLNESLRSYAAMPTTYALQDRAVLLSVGSFSKEESLEALAHMSPASVAKAPAELVLGKPLEVTSLVMGNVREFEAQNALAAIGADFAFAGDGAKNGKEVLYVQPLVNPGQPVELRKANPRKNDPNDVVVVSLLTGISTVESRVLLGLLGQMLGQVAYNELRTNLQLGYVVNAGAIQLSNVQGVSTVVQGNALDADAMEAAVEHVYFEVMPRFLEKLTDAEFNSYRNSFRQGLLEPPNSFQDEFAYYWKPIAGGGTCFGLDEAMLKYLDESVTTKQAIIDAWARVLSPEAGTRQKIVVKYFSGRVPARTSWPEARAAFEKRGVGEAGLAQLQAEFENTFVLDRADSAARAKLLARGSYFSRELKCEPAAAASALLARKSSLRGSFWGFGAVGKATSAVAK